MTHRRLRKVWERTRRAREQRLGPEVRAAAQVRLAEARVEVARATTAVEFWRWVNDGLAED